MLNSQILSGFDASFPEERRRRFFAKLSVLLRLAAKSFSSPFNLKYGILGSSSPYKKVIFVSDIEPGERLSGDHRLVVDLAEKLALGFDVPSQITTPYQLGLDRIIRNRLSPHRLYVGINCNHPALRGAHQFVSVAINNDLAGVSEREKCDVYFEPFYKKFSNTYDSTVLPLDTLPSRITPENVAAAAFAKEIDTNNRPVIVIMIRDIGPTEISKLVDTVRVLSQRHNACFFVGTGPRTGGATETLLEEKFKDIPDSYVHCWNKDEGKENPYRLMLGVATHLVTSGTLSTTSDMLATGKPVYYYNDGNGHINQQLKIKLIREGAVGEFGPDMLDKAAPDEVTRARFAGEWKDLAARFVDEVKVTLQKKNKIFKAKMRRKLLRKAFPAYAAFLTFSSIGCVTPISDAGLISVTTAQNSQISAAILSPAPELKLKSSGISKDRLPRTHKQKAKKRDYSFAFDSDWQKKEELMRKQSVSRMHKKNLKHTKAPIRG